MQRQPIQIINKLGLHARAAAKLVQLANSFSSQIYLKKAEQTVNAKSIMGVMMLAASQGTRLELIAEGKDEQSALQAISQLVQSRFGEKE